MINTGRQYTLYYNAPKQETNGLEKKLSFEDLAITKKAEGALAGFTTREFRITADMQKEIGGVYYELLESAKKGMQKIGNKMRTKTSDILREAAYAETAILNYSDEIQEEKARDLFSRIVKKEKRKSRIILGAEIFSLAIFYVPPLLFVPFTSIIFGSAIAYQAATMRTLSKGIHNISFAPNPDVSNLEKIISGEKGLELAIPDLIEYRAAKGL